MAVKKTREDHQREEQVQARIDLLRTEQQGAFGLGPLGSMFGRSPSRIEEEIQNAQTTGDEWRPRPAGFSAGFSGPFSFVAFVVLLLAAIIIITAVFRLFM